MLLQSEVDSQTAPNQRRAGKSACIMQGYMRHFIHHIFYQPIEPLEVFDEGLLPEPRPFLGQIESLPRLGSVRVMGLEAPGQRISQAAIARSFRANHQRVRGVDDPATTDSRVLAQT